MATMKPRHAAALALVGWYLMLPPWVSHGRFDPEAPLSKWKYAGSFDSARECDEKKWSLFDHFKKHPHVKDYQWYASLYGFSRCIATDDPRLKEK